MFYAFEYQEYINLDDVRRVVFEDEDMSLKVIFKELDWIPISIKFDDKETYIKAIENFERAINPNLGAE